MIELTTNFFCLTRMHRTQQRPAGPRRDYYRRRGGGRRRLPARRLDSPWSPGHLRARLSGGVAPPAPRLGAPSALQLVTRVVSIRLGLDGLAGRRGVGRVGHGRQAMGQGHGAGDNAFNGSRDAAGGHAHHAWGVPAGRGGMAGEASQEGDSGPGPLLWPHPLVQGPIEGRGLL